MKHHTHTGINEYDLYQCIYGFNQLLLPQLFAYFDITSFTTWTFCLQHLPMEGYVLAGIFLTIVNPLTVNRPSVLNTWWCI